MSNQERLKEYLIGEKAYLKSYISNGKVIMLSGKWGSGKTHFWKNELENDLIEFQSKEQKAYVYSSLYGNTSLEKIEDNIYAQAYLCSIGGENVVSKGYKKAKDFGKRFGGFCSLLDVSKLVDGIDEIQQNNIKNSALLYLKDGGLICFDDFERKSKDVDLNDLFGFISHLAIDLNCKVVIILNDDVFVGEEKSIFSNVKEKSVSKFLKYEPSIRNLFKSIIFEKDNNKFKYSKLRKHIKVILESIEETEELNARIYIQILDNIIEWIDKKQEAQNNILRCLILVNINFILNHKVYQLEEIEYQNQEEFDPRNPDKGVMKKNECFVKSEYSNNVIFLEIINKMLSSSEFDAINWYEGINKKSIGKSVEYLLKDKNLVNSAIFNKKLNIFSNINENIFRKINNFIETGIL